MILLLYIRALVPTLVRTILRSLQRLGRIGLKERLLETLIYLYRVRDSYLSRARGHEGRQVQRDVVNGNGSVNAASEPRE